MKHELQVIFEQYGIKNITIDSRNIPEHAVFIAVRGATFNGNDFIEQALAGGAIIAITDDETKAIEGKIYYIADHIKDILEAALDLIYPLMPARLMAVTGTNGKSSVVSYIYQILNLLGKKVCSIGTLGIKCNVQITKSQNSPYDFATRTSLTTLDAVSLRAILHLLAQNNIEYVAFEASSHGLEQGRMVGIKVDVAGFTSFSQDHLDYHKTMEQYLAAKLKLFSDHLKPDAIAVIKHDKFYMPQVESFLSNHDIPCVKIGEAAKVDIHFSIIEHNLDQQVIKCSSDTDQEYIFATKIIGSFQASNLLIAAKMVEYLGFALLNIINILPNLKAVAGRLQKINMNHGGPYIFVDYAHTPDALEKSLAELKALLPIGGKLFVVFGCGGDRDQVKRPIMGAIASNIADIVIITDDNPRTEDPSKIRLEIASGAPNAEIIDSREKAIQQTIERLSSRDVLLISGKGHENYQIIGNVTHSFSDIEIARKYLENKLAQQG